MRISDWSSDVCSSDLSAARHPLRSMSYRGFRASGMKVRCTSPAPVESRIELFIRSPCAYVKDCKSLRLIVFTLSRLSIELAQTGRCESDVGRLNVLRGRSEERRVGTDVVSQGRYGG